MIKINDDSVFVAEAHLIEETYDYMDTLGNGKITRKIGAKFLGYEYDTLLLNLE